MKEAHDSLLPDVSKASGIYFSKINESYNSRAVNSSKKINRNKLFHDTSPNFSITEENSVNKEEEEKGFSQIKLISSMTLSTIKRTKTFFHSDSSYLKDIKRLNTFNLNKFLTENEFTVINIKKEKPFFYFMSQYKNYCIIKCKNITTYYIDGYVFSLFTNPDDFSNIDQVKSVFIYQNNIDNRKQFILPDTDNRIYTKLDSEGFNEFINGINDFLNKKEVIEIEVMFRKKKICHIILGSILLIISISMIIFFFLFDEVYANLEIENFWIFFFLFLSIFLLFLLYSFKFLVSAFYANWQFKFYNLMHYRLVNYCLLENYVNNWNKHVLLPKNLFVSIPVNIEYLHFILDPTKEIILEHHEFVE